jgi:hypothetical protein
MLIECYWITQQRYCTGIDCLVRIICSFPAFISGNQTCLLRSRVTLGASQQHCAFNNPPSVSIMDCYNASGLSSAGPVSETAPDLDAILANLRHEIAA